MRLARTGDAARRRRLPPVAGPARVVGAANPVRAPSRRSCLPTSSPSSTPPAPPARPRACSARTRSTTGGASTAPRSSASAPATCSARRCRCSTSTPSTPSPRPRSPAPASSSSRASRPRRSGRRCARARPPSSTCSARWCRSCWRSRCRRRSASHRVRIGLGPGVPASAAAAFRERTGVPLLEGYGSTETNFVIASAPDRSRPGCMGWLQAGLRGAGRRCARRRAAAGRSGRTAAARRRAVRVRQRLLRQARGDRRRLAQSLVPHRRPGACARPTAPFASSTGSRTRSAGAARTSRRTRSSRCC